MKKRLKVVLRPSPYIFFSHKLRIHSGAATSHGMNYGEFYPKSGEKQAK